MSMRAMESTRALGEHHESRFLSVANLAQTNANVNLVNGRPHRWVAGGASASTRVMTLSDFIAMKLAFDKANVPTAGRIAIVDPIVEATLNSITNLVNVSNNPMFEGIVTEGFAKDHKFVKNIFGFDIWTSNRLAVKTATEALNASSYGLANDTAEVGD
jgi:methenyltetrahydromethanopterin cyclohydrolase